MEYEIDDDPQGLADGPEADRDGGLRGDGVFVRKDTQVNRFDCHDDDDEATAVRQFGEAA